MNTQTSRPNEVHQTEVDQRQIAQLQTWVAPRLDKFSLSLDTMGGIGAAADGSKGLIVAVKE